MKSYKKLVEELILECNDQYSNDDMTQKELKIAINSAKNILEMLDDGAELMRWQISAIVKASNELASVYTNMKADEEDEEDYDEDEESMYVGFEYPHMYEEVELMEEIGNYSIKKTGEKKYTHAHPEGKPIHHILHNGEVIGTIEPYSAYREKKKPGSRIVTSRTNVTKYSVHFHADKGPTKSADMPLYHKLGHSTPALALNSAAQVHAAWKTKNEEVQLDETVVKQGSKEHLEKLKNMLDKVKPGSVDHSQIRSAISAMFGDQHIPAKHKIVKPEFYEEIEQLDEIEGSAKRNRELHTTGRISKDEFNRRMGYGKHKTKGPAGVGPFGNNLYKNLVKSAVTKNKELDEGYNDPVHRKYISDVVHEYFPKDDPKHDKIVDHLHTVKNFGTKTSDSLEAAAGISTGAAKRITKAVAEHLKANFGTPGKSQTQAQRVDSYLKQKWVKPR